MQQTTVFKTETGNTYLNSPRVSQLLLLHPVMGYLLGLLEQGKNLEQWLDSLKENSITLDSGATIPKDQLEYYIKKYTFLLEQGYFDPVTMDEKLSGRLTGEAIKFNLANGNQLTFEVTESCNLNCKYCGYGELYNKTDPRTDKNMDFAMARRMIDYMANLWNSDLNVSHHKAINISFYGGEPLLNFPLIHSVITYIESLPMMHNHFHYSMTTNGLLVAKHMDFLVEKQFQLHISLDGDELHNGYRVFHNGKSAHQTIIQNIDALRAKYPDYFDKYVGFISVLHNKNGVSETMNFFRKKYNKRSLIVELNPYGIEESKKEEFWQTYKNYNESLNQAEDACDIRRDEFMGLPEGRAISLFLTQYSGFVFDRTAQMLQGENLRPMIPTATCQPFAKKIYVTVGGDILPCERINRKNILGKVTRDAVDLNLEKIAGLYNNIYEKLSPLCTVCYRNKSCNQCAFHLQLDEEKIKCPGCSAKERFSRDMGAQLSILEKHPDSYSEYMKGVTLS